MASQKSTPKPNTRKPPVRQAVGRERVQAKPIREVITHPAERVPIRAMASANKLKGTIKGNTQGKAKGNDPLPVGSDGRIILKPLPSRFNVKPDGSFMTPKEVYDTYASSGAYDINQSQLDSYTNLYNQAAAAQQARKNPLVQVGALAESVGNVITDIPGIVTGDAATIADANAQATIAVDTARSLLGMQTRVGGTKGTPKPIDRSLAIRKAWATRKKLYGSSGQKDK